MHFVDECGLRVEAGKGGDGAIAFRREKFVPFGGPAGGDGGRGGSVVFVADEGKSTLSDITHVRLLKAKSGENGGGRDCNGRGGKDLEVHVPVGTIVYDSDTDQLLGELTAHQQRFVVAKGGNGGLGNRHFATPTDRAPRRAGPGTPGQASNIRLELKVMADVGLLGFPNVGKSTFVSTVSGARPRIADYPFTTLEPHLGVVLLGDRQSGLGSSFVIADIPGLVPGAAEGHGLGIRFLKHVERTRVLLHLVTVTDEEAGRDPIEDYRSLRSELKKFNTDLSERTEFVALSKMDLPHVRDAYPELKDRFRAEFDVELLAFSCAIRDGLKELLLQLSRSLSDQRSSVGALESPKLTVSEST